MASAAAELPALSSNEVETRRFTFDEVTRMVEVGILDEDEPVELLRST